MADDWENAAESNIVIKPTVPSNVNKWAGEDEADDVKDSWEDEEEKKDEEKVEKKSTTTATTKAPIKPAALLLLQEDAEEKRLANMTPEERVAEKLHLQKIQEEKDLKTALETLGILPGVDVLEAFNPQTKEEFKEFGTTLSWKISEYKDSPHFPQFAEDLVRNICADLSTTELKKIKIFVDNLHSEKVKQKEKQNTKKSSGKGKNKVTIRADTDDINDYKRYGNDYDDFDDDFM
uniref:Eukaryotic translation initiation factor 3 subunit J n=1 Tax=Glossina brevipalpis TaxID=37001 RepID=A0A1A9W844_9MUSC